MATTTNGLPYPTGTDVPDVPYWNQQLAEALDDVAGDSGWLPVNAVLSGITRVRGQVRVIGPWFYFEGEYSGSLTAGTTELAPAGAVPPAARPTRTVFGTGYMSGGFPGMGFVRADGSIAVAHQAGSTRSSTQISVIGLHV